MNKFEFGCFLLNWRDDIPDEPEKPEAVINEDLLEFELELAGKTVVNYHHEKQQKNAVLQSGV